MPTLTYIDLQHQFPGRFIARDDEQVVADAETFGELCDKIKRLAVQAPRLSIEFVEPVDSVSVY